MTLNELISALNERSLAETGSEWCGKFGAIYELTKRDAERFANLATTLAEFEDICAREKLRRYGHGDYPASAVEIDIDALPQLIGSEKQVAWATTIRAKKIPEVADYIDACRYRAPSREVYEKLRAEIISHLSQKTEAALWIDFRYENAQHFLDFGCRKMHGGANKWLMR